jgi:hypothetical protein
MAKYKSEHILKEAKKLAQINNTQGFLLANNLLILT